MRGEKIFAYGVKGISHTYMEAIRNFYGGVTTHIQTPIRLMEPISVKVGQHQGLAQGTLYLNYVHHIL